MHLLASILAVALVFWRRRNFVSPPRGYPRYKRDIDMEGYEANGDTTAIHYITLGSHRHSSGMARNEQRERTESRKSYGMLIPGSCTVAIRCMSYE